MPGNRRLRLHFQTVWHNAVHRFYHTIKSRQDPQMILHILILAVLKDRRRHICVLDAVIDQERRRQVLSQIHMCKPLGVLPGDLVIADPESFLLLICQTTDPVFQNFCFLHKDRKVRAVKGFCIYPHLLCRGYDDLHDSSPSICAALSAAFTLPNAFSMIPFSSIRYVVRITPMETLP